MKKGFTLLELLAVIVVLAVIALIAVPIMLNVISKAKLGSLRDSAYGILEESNLYYAQYRPENNIRFDIVDNKVTSDETDKMIKYKGNIKSGAIVLASNGTVTLCVTDGTNSAYKNYTERDITVVENDRCYIPDNRVIVYMESTGPTRTELTNQELTDAVAALQDKIYPVGSIYLTTSDDTVEKVQARFGGTWEAYATGKTLVGVDTNQTEFNEVNKTGGEKTHTLTINEMPSHSHNFGTTGSNSGNGNYVVRSSMGGNLSSGGWNGYNTPIGYTGGSQAHNNLQPYITVYMYRRVS